MPKKAPSLKNRIWERERRNRLNASFEELASLLPEHNTNNILSKVLVIQKAAEFIRQLQCDAGALKENKDLISQLRLEIDSLKERCTFLSSALEQSGLIIPESTVNIPIKNQYSNLVITQSNNKCHTITCKAFEDTKLHNDQAESSNTKQNISEINESCAKQRTMENQIKIRTTQDKLEKISNKTVNKKNKKRLPQADSQNGHNTSSTKMCPILIIMNDSKVITQSSFSSMHTSNGLTLVKNPVVFPNVITPGKIGIPGKKNHCKNRKIASKGFKLDLKKTMVLNKVPIPPLSKSQISNIDPQRPSKLNSETKIKTKPLKRVTYRMLRQSKILKKRVFPKNKVMEKENITIDKNSLNIEPQKDCSLINTPSNENKMEVVNAENSSDQKTLQSETGLKSVKSDQKTTSTNRTSTTATVTYSIDSLCNANFRSDDIISNSSTLGNNQLVQNATEIIHISEKQQNTDMKKNFSNTCLSNSKCDPLSDLSNDLFASLQVAPIGSHQAGCTSPTAAFLLAFPLVSTLNGGKINQVALDDNSETQETNSTLLQIGNQKSNSDPQSSNILNLDHFSTIFSSKDMYSNNLSTTCDNKMPLIKSEMNNIYDAKCENINKSAMKTSDKLNSDNKLIVTSDNNYIKSNSECLYTYGNTENMTCTSSLQNTLYNAGFNSNKDEKNKFSHTNIMSNINPTPCLNTVHSVYEPLIISSQSQNKYHSEVNYAQGKTPSHSTYTLITSAQNQTPSNSMAAYSTPKPVNSDASETYNNFMPFYETVHAKEKRCLSNVPSSTTACNIKQHITNPFTVQTNTSTQDYNAFGNKISNTKNPDCNMEKNKIENNYNGQEVKYQKSGAMRYKPYACNTSVSQNTKHKRNDSRDMKDYQQTSKPPVNWMTSPDIRQNSYAVSKFNKDYIQNVPINNYNYNNIDCNVSASHKEPFFIIPPNSSNLLDDTLNASWSHSAKIQENQSQLNLPTTLPTLVGDLALGTTTPLLHGQDGAKQYTSCYTDKKEHSVLTHKDHMAMLTEKNCAKGEDGHHSVHNAWNGNFSVSQLVEQFKSVKDAPTSSNDRLGLANSKAEQHEKHLGDKTLYDNPKRNAKHVDDICNIMEMVNGTDLYKNHQHNTNTINTKSHKKYSAEALISDNSKQENNKGMSRQQQFFPFVDYTTTTDMHQNSMKINKQCSKNTNASTMTSTTYSYPNHMTSNNYNFNKSNIGISNSEQCLGNKLLHLSSTADLPTQSANLDNYKTNMYKPLSQENQSTNKNNINSNGQFTKKSLKREKSQDNTMSALLDLNYLPVPTGNHSPIFSEDQFYNYPIGFTTNASSQPYQNQNILYSGNVRCHLNHSLPAFSAQIAAPPVAKNINSAHLPIPSPNIGNNSSSLTNFNLSTIFPEINEKIRPTW